MGELQTVWNNILDNLELKINSQGFRTWFNDTTLHDKSAGQNLVIKVPTKFTADYLNKNYASFIEELCMQMYNKKYSIKFTSNPSVEEVIHNKTPDKIIPSLNGRRMMLNPKYSFEQFIVGKSNCFAHSAALAVAESPGTTYNPLFIYGESGMGKTHLMQAIGQFVKDDDHPNTSVYYITAEEFTNEMIDSLRTNSMPAFRNKYRNIDILLIDDIHFLARKEGIQEEFFHTFNTLYDNKKQIVMTSDRPPKDINDLEKRLVSRFEWGLLADLKTPDFETRMAILKKKAESEEIVLNEATFEFISTNIISNVRALEGSLIRIHAHCSYKNIDPRELDVDTCQEILSDMISDKVFEININTVMNEVCSYFNLNPGQLLSDTRKKEIVYPRQIAMYLTSLLLPQLPLKAIAQYYQRKDHTTVLHAKKLILENFRKDSDFRIQIETIMKNIKKTG